LNNQGLLGLYILLEEVQIRIRKKRSRDPDAHNKDWDLKINIFSILLGRFLSWEAAGWLVLLHKPVQLGRNK
jgi:hypothetical protein